jgi:hypothetical protein
MFVRAGPKRGVLGHVETVFNLVAYLLDRAWIDRIVDRAWLGDLLARS